MLKLYHQPISPNSRRVWIALIEKGLPFEMIVMNLDGDQFQPEFLAISPFHHIPALVDGDFSLVESQAILDYLEAKYPNPPLLPEEPKALGIVQMVRMATVNELAPAMSPLIGVMMGISAPEPEKMEAAKQKLAVVLQFFQRLLNGGHYFGGDRLSLADITAGVAVPWLPKLGMLLDDYPQIQAWCDRLQQRPAWQTTQATPEMLEQMKATMQARMAKTYK
ncbi:MAG: glutathione S-transferase family protein [Cyanosarcina radialis HA8281-LM2]|jgi:glutathione S-transferase|nr:glutathione S-transferase family protein [Cyanosarcina radialis HA8281-LM2]